MINTTVIIIGGGATGSGVLRDLSMRGIPAIMLEQGGLAYGTSSRFHGLLHSGARYAVNDNESAKECIEENMILRKIGKQCVELTEGFFVQTKQDDPEFISKWLEGCKTAGIKTEEVSLEDAFKLEPNLSRDILKVYRVPDSCIDGFRLVWQNAMSARKYGGELYTYHKVIEIITEGGKVKGVKALNKINNEIAEFGCDYIINASGSWAGEMVALSGLAPLPISPDRGTLLVFNHRFTSRVINRLHKSSDGDIFVPHGSVTILGTTSAEADTPDDKTPTSQEIVKLLDIGRAVFPYVDDYRILRAFAGTRPLYGAKGAGRSASRNFNIVNHTDEGLYGFVSIFGGKLTTYRLMAEKVTDVVANLAGVSTKCRTADEPIIPDITEKTITKAKKYFPQGAVKIVADRIGADFDKVLDNMEKTQEKNEIVCECEMVTLSEIKYVAGDDASYFLNDIRLRTRLGMGTCQGTFCSLRAISALENENIEMKLKPTDNIKNFLQERWNGLRPALWGGQLREAELTRAIYLSTLNFDGEGYEA